MTTIFDLATSSLSDDQLLASVSSLACAERCATAQLIAALVELYRRKLFLGQGYPSLFSYCTQVLHLSEHAAYGRIEAVRAVSRFPVVLDYLANGDLTLTTVCLLAPLLTAENHQALLAAARHKSRREVEQLVAMNRPKPDVPAVVRKLPSPGSQNVPETPTLNACLPCSPSEAEKDPEPRPAAVDVTPPRPMAPPSVVTPLAPERYKIQFTASREAHEKLRRAQSLLRHVIPNGDPAAVFERALDALRRTICLLRLEMTARIAQTVYRRDCSSAGSQRPGGSEP